MVDTYFFIHVPRTGGMSFEALLAGIFPAEAICPHYYEQDCLSPALDFSRYRLYRGHHSYFLTTALPPETKVITILRHPVSRAMSTYEHIQHNPRHPRHKLLTEQTRSLAEFVHHPFLGQQVSNTQTRALGRSLDFAALRSVAAVNPAFAARAEAFIEITRTVCVSAEELARAKDRLKHMAFFGLTERFDETCRRFLRQMGRPIDSIPKINTTAPEVVGRRNQYGPDDIAAVTAANALDLELYEFARQLFDQVK